MRIFVAHSSAFPFEEKLYAPLRSSSLFKEHEFTLPEEKKYSGTWNTKEAIENSDFVVADVSLPSTGAGIELGWASAAGTPIIAIHEKGSVPSTVITYLTDTVISYETADDMVAKLTEAIQRLT